MLQWQRSVTLWCVRIEVIVSEFDPPCGVVRLHGRDEPYAGWLQLLGLLSRALEGERGAEGSGQVRGEPSSTCPARRPPGTVPFE